MDKRIIAKRIEDLTATERKGTIRVLTGILDLYRKPSAWMRGNIADDTKFGGLHEMPTEKAARFCLIGAARKVDTAHEPHALRALSQVLTGGDEYAAYDDLGWASKHPYPHSVYQFNDDERHSLSDVRAVIRKAIAAVKRGGV